MKKKTVQAIMKNSFQKGSLDRDKVMSIANHLSRAELRQYIRALKMAVQKQTVIVDMPAANEKIEKEVKDLFSEKKVVTRINKDLILGMKITANDMIYDLSMQHILDEIKENIQN